MAYLKRVFDSLASVVTGMSITFARMVSPMVTERYPDERWDPPHTFRGLPVLLSNAEGTLRCTGCRACERVCLAGAIRLTTDIETEPSGRKRAVLKTYEVDLGRCVMCGMCAESCPSNALTMAHDYELADYTRDRLVYDLPHLQAIGRAYEYDNQKELPFGFGEGKVVPVASRSGVAPRRSWPTFLGRRRAS